MNVSTGSATRRGNFCSLVTTTELNLKCSVESVILNIYFLVFCIYSVNWKNFGSTFNIVGSRSASQKVDEKTIVFAPYE